MKRKEIEQKLVNCLENVSIYIDVDDNVDDIDLENYIESSIQFISLVIEIEKEFSIEIPDEMLDINTFKTIDMICDLLNEILIQNESF